MMQVADESKNQLSVGELIKILQSLPQDAGVLAEGCQMCCHAVTGVKVGVVPAIFNEEGYEYVYLKVDEKH